MNMDAIDYATMDGVRTPIARAVLSYVDYVIPEVCEGPYWSEGLHAIAELKETLVLAKMSLIGRTPDLVNHNPRDAEYATDWLKRLHYMVATVRKGVLLLSSEVGYLERDANLSGCLEVPADHRFVYLQEEGKVIKYMKAMLRPTVYGDAIGKRIMDACLAGDSGAVKGLLKARAPPDVEDMQGQSALMRAAQKGDRTIVRPRDCGSGSHNTNRCRVGPCSSTRQESTPKAKTASLPCCLPRSATMLRSFECCCGRRPILMQRVARASPF